MSESEELKARAGGPLGDEHVRPVRPPAVGVASRTSAPGYPLSAIVGQDDLIQALLVCAVNPVVGGVLVRGERGTAKSTAVRALAPMLGGPVTGLEATGNPAVPLVELPLGATLDRLVGTLDLRAAMGGEHRVEPGLLARAHGGVLYVDEVNLLGDHLVDALLDAAASGVVTVERDGVSVAQDARFLLVGTMNPEEGDLRPQLLDRFGLGVEIAGPRDPRERAAIVARRMAYDADPSGFAADWSEHEAALAATIEAARSRLEGVALPEAELLRISTVCASLDLDGVRGDLVCAHAARAIAALEGDAQVTADHVSKAAHLALRHRMRRDPLAPPPPGGRDQAIDDALDEAADAGGDQSGDPPPAHDDIPQPDDHTDAETTTGDAPGNDAADREGAATEPDKTDRSTSQNPQSQPETEWQPSPELAPPPRAPRENERSERPTRVRPTAVPSRIAESALRLDRTAPRASASRLRNDPTLDVPTGRSPGGRLAVVDARPAHDDDPIAVLPTVLATLRGDDRPQTAITGGGRGALLCLIVDTSGSMAAQRRLARVKGALEAALRRAYARRDLVAVIAFGGEGAETLVEPGMPIEFAARAVHALPAGGKTPLAAGITHGATVLEGAARGTHAGRARIAVLLTDGRADDRAGHARTALRRVVAASDRTVVVDLEDGRARLGLAADLAAAAGADLTRLVDPAMAAGPRASAA